MVISTALASFFAIVIGLILLVRFQKRRLAAFHRAFTNRMMVRFATLLPGFGVVINVGRNTGMMYRTPVNVFRRPYGFLIALTYGKESGWVKNVLAEGGCQVETRCVLYQLSDPRVVCDPSHQSFPWPVRLILGLIGANHYLQLSDRTGNSDTSLL